MDSKKLEKFQRVWKDVTESITREEFVLAFKVLNEFVKKVHNELSAEDKNNLAQIQTLASTLAKDTKENLQNIKGQIASQMESVRKSVMTKMQEVDDKLATVQNGEDADEELIVEKVLGKIEIPDANTLFENLPAQGRLIRDGLELLSGDERLDKSAIKGLDSIEEDIKTLKSTSSTGSRGGGVSAIGVRQAFKYIAHTEAPTGDINGVNTTYTVKNDIFFVFGFTLNGEQIAELPNFTYKGKTLTFSTALPTAYSGKDFEIKYIG
jgi:hypothetical protein